MLDGASELVLEVMRRNRIAPDDLISILFTATPDLTAEFPAYAARQLGPDRRAADVRVARSRCPARCRARCGCWRTSRPSWPRADIRHVYLRGAAALRTDLPQ